MLVHSHFKVFNGDAIYLPAWIRAPAGLKDSVVANITLTQYAKFAGQLVISPVSHKCWTDLWLVELQCFEKEGLTRKIISLFDEAKINIEYISSSRIKEGTEHFFSILCDCKKYESDIDGTRSDRIKRENPHLKELHAELLLGLIDDLSFHDGKEPNLTIRRLNSYNHVSANIINHDHVSIKQRKVRKGKIDIDLELVEAIRETCDCNSTDKLFYQMFIDTNERIVRVNFFKSSENLYIFRIHFDQSAKIMKSILDIIDNDGFDILGCQMNYPPTIANISIDGKDLVPHFASIDFALWSRKPPPPDRKVHIRELVDKMADRHPDMIILDEKSLKIRKEERSDA